MGQLMNMMGDIKGKIGTDISVTQKTIPEERVRSK